jgi:hypothetical protein
MWSLFDELFSIDSLEEMGWRDTDGFLVLPKEEDDDEDNEWDAMWE